MQRILIVGPCGAGKSTLARKLGERLQLPVHHLDVHYWLPNWTPTPPDEWPNKVRALIEQDTWIIDGNSSRTLPMRMARADTIIHLNFPRGLCIRRILSRVWREYGKTRIDMAPGCRERFDIPFLWYVWNFHKHYTPIFLNAIQQRKDEQTAYTLCSPKDVKRFLNEL